MPALLEPEPPSAGALHMYWPTFKFDAAATDRRELARVFRFTFVPLGLFPHMICHLLKTVSVPAFILCSFFCFMLFCLFSTLMCVHVRLCFIFCLSKLTWCVCVCGLQWQEKLFWALGMIMANESERMFVLLEGGAQPQLVVRMRGPRSAHKFVQLMQVLVFCITEHTP